MDNQPTRYTVTDGKMVLVLEVADEGGFVVTAPFIEGLITEAETLEEAFEMARDETAELEAARAELRKTASVAGK